MRLASARSATVWSDWFGQTLDTALCAALSVLLAVAYLATFAITALRHESWRGLTLFVVLLAASQLAQAAGLYALGDAPPARLLDGWGTDAGAGLRSAVRTSRARRNLGVAGFSLIAAAVLLALGA